MCVHKRGDRWLCRVYLGRHPQTGKRKYTYRTFATRKEAKQAEAELRMKLQLGTHVPASKKTVGDYLIEWLRATRINLRPSTLPGYEIAITRHLVPRLGAIQLQKLNAIHITGCYADLLEHGRLDGHGGLSPRTVRIFHTILRKALADAVKTRQLERNPADGASPPKARAADAQARAKRRYWDEHELGRFLDSLTGSRLGPAFHLAATTGMRRGEVLGLRWRDLDLDQGRLVVEQTLLMPKRHVDGVWRYELVFGEPKSAHGRRSIDLDERTVAVLRRHRRAQIEEQLRAGELYQDSGLVFRTPQGGPLMPEVFSQAFKRAAKAAGLRPIRLHDLRHTHVALLAKAGVPAKVIQERVGHHSAGFTLDAYGGVFAGQQREAAERLAALLSRSGSTTPS